MLVLESLERERSDIIHNFKKGIKSSAEVSDRLLEAKLFEPSTAVAILSSDARQGPR